MKSTTENVLKTKVEACLLSLSSSHLPNVTHMKPALLPKKKEKEIEGDTIHQAIHYGRGNSLALPPPS